jgi:hypothetical protein
MSQRTRNLPTLSPSNKISQYPIAKPILMAASGKRTLAIRATLTRGEDRDNAYCGFREPPIEHAGDEHRGHRRLRDADEGALQFVVSRTMFCLSRKARIAA